MSKKLDIETAHALALCVQEADELGIFKRMDEKTRADIEYAHLTAITEQRLEEKPRKGMILDVYRHVRRGAFAATDCTNGGISATRCELLLVGEGVPEIFEETPERPAVKIGSAGGRPHLRPVDDDGVWFMFGGNFAYSCDSRLRPLLGDGPVHIHDRRED